MSKETAAVARAWRVQPKKTVELAVPAASTALPSMIVVSVVFVLLSIAYNFLTPLTTPVPLHTRDGGAANPDEPAHILYAASLASGRLPVFSASSADYEAAQPPAYYVFAGFLYKLSPASAAVRAHIVRFVATAFGVGLLWVTFFIVRRQAPFDDDLAAFASLLIALVPMNISLSSSVSNDTATNLVIGIFLLQLANSLKTTGNSTVNFVLLGLVLGLGIWTKSSTLVLFGALLAAVLYAVWQKLLTAIDSLRALAVSVLAALVVSAPWLIRNRLLYGDFFAQTVVFHELAERNFATSTLIDASGLNWYLSTFVQWTFASYWGVFDSMTLFLPEQIYGVLGIVAALSLIAGLVAVNKSKVDPGDRAAYAGWAALVVFTVVAYLQYNAHFFQLQGRYLYPALIPLSAMSALGIKAIVPSRYLRWTQFGCFIGLLLLNLLCLTMISGRYST